MTEDIAPGGSSCRTPADARIAALALLAREDDSFRAYGSMERQALNVLATWQNVVSRVNWLYFHTAGPGGPPNLERKLPATIRQVAEEQHIRWPHDDWARAVDAVGDIRHRLAHMLWVDAIEGASPNRVMKITVLGKQGAPRRVEGRPGELSWEDNKWSAQWHHQIEVTEQDIRNALNANLWMKRCVHGLGRIIDVFDQYPSMTDDHELDVETLALAWWLEEWGEPAKTIRVDQLRTDRDDTLSTAGGIDSPTT